MSLNIKKAAAGAIASLLLISVLFFAFFIATEVAHDCEGEDCAICSCIESCENLLSRFGDIIIFSIFALPVVLLVMSFFYSDPVVLITTLVSQKIRLDD